MMAGGFYKAVVQAVLLFGSNTWAMTPRLKKAHEIIHHRSVRRLADMGLKLQQDGIWVFPPIGSALTKVGLDYIGVYITCIHNNQHG